MRVFASYDTELTQLVSPLLVEFGRVARLKQPFATEKEFGRQWNELLRAKTACTIIAEDDEGEVVGALGMLITPRVYWEGLMAAETFFWIRPTHRGGMTAARLLKEFEEEARRRECEVVHVGHKSHFRSDEMAHFYKKFGYSPIEVMYQKEL